MQRTLADARASEEYLMSDDLNGRASIDWIAWNDLTSPVRSEIAAWVESRPTRSMTVAPRCRPSTSMLLPTWFQYPGLRRKSVSRDATLDLGAFNTSDS